MHINNINNNVSFSKLHIPSTKANKIALEKFLKTSPETLKEALADIDRESGEDHVYLKQVLNIIPALFLWLLQEKVIIFLHQGELMLHSRNI